MSIRRVQLAAAWFLLLFCCATLVSPHHHLNPIADLITDGQSDSGRVLVVKAPSSLDRGSIWTTGRIVDDDSCLACFWHDVTASVAAVFALCFVALALSAVAAASRILPVLPFRSPLLNRGPPSPPFSR